MYNRRDPVKIRRNRESRAVTGEFSYRDYVTDETFLADYNEYQKKYAAQIRESDRIVLRLIGETLARRDPASAPARLLDIGCSTKNLLLHVKRAFPKLSLTGADLAEASLAQCRENPELAGIAF